MLRIRYKSKPNFPGFERRGILKSECAQILGEHHWSLWRYEIIESDGTLGQTSGKVEIPVGDVVAEWQDGDVWNESGPSEVIPVPPQPRRKGNS